MLARTQIYISTHTSPFINLALEHILLTRSHPDATVLFLYANAPCIVLGRNQNPWLEANVPLLKSINSGREDVGLQGQGGQKVWLVRRRSGGGTVFHDLGNQNYSVICPPAVFDRDKHAEMVARALRRLGVISAHVNARHDICIESSSSSSSSSMSPTSPSTFKVSGSAYKLTRLRSLHHGTCLLSSPNLPLATRLLRSPASSYALARGVESVRSPISNVLRDGDEWRDAVIDEFEGMYGPAERVVLDASRGGVIAADGVVVVEDVKKGADELMAKEWVYGQTPQFVFSSHPVEEDPRSRPEVPFDGPLKFEARHGALTSLSWKGQPIAIPAPRIWEASGWAHLLAPIGPDAGAVGGWLDNTMGICS